MAQPCSGRVVAIVVGAIFVVALCVPHAAALCDGGVANGQYNPAGEQCDNNNGRGCTSNCLVDSLFYCWGTPSTCVRSYAIDLVGSGTFNLTSATFPDAAALDRLRLEIANGTIGNGASIAASAITILTPSLVPGTTNVYSVPFTINFSNTNAGTVPIVTNNLRTAANSGRLTGVGNAPNYLSNCGDGIVQLGEQCDAGINNLQDGCTNTCTSVAGYNCRANLVSTTSTNGTNTPFWTCTVCGNSVLNNAGSTFLGGSSTEMCDDGNVAGIDGCSRECMVESGWSCTTNQFGLSSCTQGGTIFVCGNGVLQTGEVCDDGNSVSGDGCAGNCLAVESGFTCVTNTAGRSICSLGTSFVCGNGVIQAGEACDDGNVVSGDGCAANCLAIESGFICVTNTAGRSVCSVGTGFVCGNGVLQAGEVCDDGNVVSGDGCAGNCLAVESGFTCVTNAAGMSICSVGTGFTCGNGVVQTGEACDDGNVVSGDGCAGNCLAVEAGFTCPIVGTRSVCTLIGTGVCGNGILNTGETCDDGNLVSGDGCSSACITEAGFICNIVGSQSLCYLGTCGNNVVNTGEQCDDGNHVPLDGCSALCKTESGYNCIFDSALGRSVCSLFNANINRFDADDDDSDELWWVILLVILLALCLLLLLYLLCKKRKRREPEPVVMYEPKPAPLFVHPPPAIAPAVMYEVYDTY